MSRIGQAFRAAAVALFTGLAAGPASAQQPPPAPEITDYVMPDSVLPAGHFRRPACTLGCPTPACPTPGCPTPYPPGTMPPGYYPGYPAPPGRPPGTPPGMPPGMPPMPGQTPAVPEPTMPSEAPSFAGFEAGAGLGQTASAKGAYIENAVPVTMFRLRFDAGYNNNRPDRANFFYPKCGCFGTRDSLGPPLPETNVDYQELTPYLEVALNNRLSVFADIPIRFLNPDMNSNKTGLSDVSFGAKYAIIRTQRRVVSLWARTITPTGAFRDGLGTANWWIEPGILYLEQMSERWQVFGELRDQAFLSKRTDFTGNVLRYGLGSSYVVADGPWGYAAPVGEFVGWTALGGKEADEIGNVTSSSGDTIVNAKVGLRVGFGEPALGQFFATRSDLYVGYARALTGEVWYKDMFRLEYRFFY
jgi:hypothetical protein